MTDYTIPRANAPIAGTEAPTTQWYNFIRYLDTRSSSAAGDVQAEITVIAEKLGSPDGTVDNIPPLGNVTSVQGKQSIASSGIGVVQLRLVNDAETVDAVSFYGTDSAGVKGWSLLYDAFADTDNIFKINTDGIVSFDLTDLADSGTGAALVRITRDSKGRISGTHAATTTDLAEGSNLYFTNERAQDAVGAALDGTGDVPLSYDDAGNKISAALSSGVLASLALADSALQPTASDGVTYAQKNGMWLAIDAALADTTSFQIGRILVQTGSATAPASGTVNTSVDVTYPVAYDTALFARVAVTSGTQPGGPVLDYQTARPTATKFTPFFDVAEGATGNPNITVDIDFDWIAVGLLPAIGTLAITGSFAAATVGVAYSSSLPITGGTEPYSLTGGTGIASGSLDTGFALSITGSTGAYFLTLTCASPATADTMSFTASVDSTDAQTATSPQSVVVSAASSFVAGLHFDGTNGSTTFTDVSGKTWTRNGSTTALDTSVKKFGTASLLVGTTTGGSTNNGITTPHHADFEFDTGEWTIGWWHNFTDLTGFQNAFSHGGASAGAILAETGNGDGKMKVYISGAPISSSVAAVINTQVYYEVCRQKNYQGTGDDAFLLYQDGVLVASSTGINPTGTPLSINAPFAIGCYADGTFATAGHVDDFFVLKGTCLHTDGTTFTPPTAPFA